MDRILTYTRVQNTSLLVKHELSRLGPCCPTGGITRRDDPLRVSSFDDDFDGIEDLTRSIPPRIPFGDAILSCLS